MKLATYMDRNGLDDEAMAAQIGGVSSHAVKKWRYGERVPRPDAMQRLAKATGGKVTADDFMREAA
jgi:DNA-binding transcriptional regulator YdaS (Cro superfamily)